ncbi:MAG: hypothetical protein LAT79_18115 [Kiritimatiellae bacterium]|nr:hypothetical protein [Kiritimatiellia bacterium]
MPEHLLEVPYGIGMRVGQTGAGPNPRWVRLDINPGEAEAIMQALLETDAFEQTSPAPRGAPLRGWTMRLRVRHNDTEEEIVQNYHWWIGREHKAVFDNAFIEIVRQSLQAHNQSEFDSFLDKHRIIEGQMKTD